MKFWIPTILTRSKPILARAAFLATILFMNAQDAFARAGGGFGGSGGGGFGFSGRSRGPFQLILLTIVMIVVGIFYLVQRTTILAKWHRVTLALNKMSRRDPSWAKNRLTKIAREKFLLLQEAWSTQDLGTIQKHLSPELFQDWKSQIHDQIQQGERNTFEDIRFDSVMIVAVQNHIDDSMDTFTVEIRAQGTDTVVSNRELVVDVSTEDFTEYWTFTKSGKDWLLSDVGQAQEWMDVISAPIYDEESATG